MFDAARKALEDGNSTWRGNWEPTVFASAPGRVELLGNHIDYNGGPVLAAAIDRQAVVVGDPNQGALINIRFADSADDTLIDPGELSGWTNTSGAQTPADYARGVVAALIARGRVVRGGRFALASNVPIGIGMSSSAAICVALTLALGTDRPESRELVLIAQEAEHRAGTPCGTMDQSASVAGGVILFDGATLQFDRLGPELAELSFLVIDSGVHRSLSSSSYPLRVAECSRAREWLTELLGRPISHLADLSQQDIESITASNSEEALLLARVRHVVTETARVREAVGALIGPDWPMFGRLMKESGQSSAGDYAISHPVVEAIVDRLNQDPGVLGARMMGGGEGGSLISLVRNGSAPDVQKRIATLANLDLPLGEPLRQVFAFEFADGASVTQYPRS